MENQKWEKIINFFANRNKIKTIAFPHTGIREMDLRYFVNNKKTLSSKYMPNKIISHSVDTEKWLKRLSLNNKKIKLESLRFLSNKFNYKFSKNKKKTYKNQNCLVYLDIYDQNSSPILEILKKLKKNYLLNDIYVKLHPTADINIFRKLYKFAKFIITEEELINVDFIIAGSNTTASYIALYKNLPLYIYLREGYFQKIPFFEKKEINFFFDYNSFLKNFMKLKKQNDYIRKLHYNNPKIKNWKKFLLAI